MIIRFPVVPDRWSSAWGNQLLQTLQRSFSGAVSKDEETPRIVLRSPNGTLYDLTVSDTGTLTTTPTSKTRA